jgi:hypothetical protein
VSLRLSIERGESVIQEDEIGVGINSSSEGLKKNA